MLRKVTPRGTVHGLIAELPNSDTDSTFKNVKSSLKEKLKKQKEEDSQIIKARYVNNRDKLMGYCYKDYCRYGGDPLQRWYFLSGEVYDVPKGLIKEINEETEKPKMLADQLTEDNKTLTRDMPLIQEHEFYPVSF